MCSWSWLIVGDVCNGRLVSAEKLREWRGVKPVAGPSGVAITTRLRTPPADELVLDAVADHVGRLRRADLASVCCPEPLAAGLDADGRRRVRRERLNNRLGQPGSEPGPQDAFEPRPRLLTYRPAG